MLPRSPVSIRRYVGVRASWRKAGIKVEFCICEYWRALLVYLHILTFLSFFIGTLLLLEATTHSSHPLSMYLLHATYPSHALSMHLMRATYPSHPLSMYTMQATSIPLTRSLCTSCRPRTTTPWATTPRLEHARSVASASATATRVCSSACRCAQTLGIFLTRKH